MKYPLTVLLIFGGCCTHSFAADEESDWGVWATGTVDFSEQHQDVVDEAVEEAELGVMVDSVEEPKMIEDRLVVGDKVPSFSAIRGFIQTVAVEITEIPDEGGADAVYGSGISGSDENLLHELDKSSLLDYETRTDNNDLQPPAAEPSDLGVSHQLVGAEFENADLLEEMSD
ncbi:MAG: hypothetical protein ACI92E_000926 [Oceanicoccus sp.]|jgi:hypothetical protein